MIEMNGCMRSFEIMTIMMTIATTKAMMSGKPVMLIPPIFNSENTSTYILIPFKNFGK